MVVKASIWITCDQMFFFSGAKKRAPDRTFRPVWGESRFRCPPAAWNFSLYCGRDIKSHLSQMQMRQKRETLWTINAICNSSLFLLSETCFPTMIRQYQNLFSASAKQAISKADTTNYNFSANILLSSPPSANHWTTLLKCKWNSL